MSVGVSVFLFVLFMLLCTGGLLAALCKIATLVLVYALIIAVGRLCHEGNGTE